MTYLQLINHSLPILKPSDTAGYALDLLSEFSLYDLPVVSEGKVVGHVSLDILKTKPEGQTLEHEVLHEPIVLQATDHILYGLRAFLQRPTQSFAVVNSENEYAGTVLSSEVWAAVAQHMSYTEYGAVLVLKLPNAFYSLAQIARLAEEENIKILSTSYSENKLAEGDMEHLMTLKLHTQHTEAFLRSLERNNYQILEYFAQTEPQTIEKDRFENLMKYLSI